MPKVEVAIINLFSSETDLGLDKVRSFPKPEANTRRKMANIQGRQTEKPKKVTY